MTESRVARLCGPDLLVEPCENFKATVAFLDVIGRSVPEQSVDVEVDLDRFGWPLRQTVDTALAVENDRFGEFDIFDFSLSESRERKEVNERIAGLSGLVGVLDRTQEL